METLRIKLQLTSEENTIKGVASVFGNMVDAFIPTIIHPGAFEKTITERGKDIKILWQHDVDEPIGIPTMLRENPIGLEFEARITQTSRGKDALALLRDGVIDAVSIGFDPVKFDFEEVDGKNIRNLREVRLWEISLVTWGIDNKARVLEVNTVTPFRDLPLAARSRPWDAAAAESRVREWAGAQDGPNARYRQGFIWYDADAADQFGSYKLLIADVIGGRLTAVPRGVFAAAAVVQGARGGVDIPDSDMPRVRSHLGRYYAKMRREFDDDSIVAPWESRQATLPMIEEYPVSCRAALIASVLQDITPEEQHGSRLASRLNSLIDDKVTDAKSRSDIIADMASAAGISPGTVNQILNASINCPPLSRLRGFARVLGTSLSDLQSRAESDGCEYNNQGISACPVVLTDSAVRIKRCIAVLQTLVPAEPTDGSLTGDQSGNAPDYDRQLREAELELAELITNSDLT